MSVRYVIRVKRVKKIATVRVIRKTMSLPWPRWMTVGTRQWATETKDPDALKAEAMARGMPFVRADQRRRGVLAHPVPPVGTRRRPARPPSA